MAIFFFVLEWILTMFSEVKSAEGQLSDYRIHLRAKKTKEKIIWDLFLVVIKQKLRFINLPDWDTWPCINSNHISGKLKPSWYTSLRFLSEDSEKKFSKTSRTAIRYCSVIRDYAGLSWQFDFSCKFLQLGKEIKILKPNRSYSRTYTNLKREVTAV